VDIYTLIGAIVGSGLFIFAGREPVRRLMDGVKSRLRK
jgi:hypothetical protein